MKYIYQLMEFFLKCYEKIMNSYFSKVIVTNTVTIIYQTVIN